MVVLMSMEEWEKEQELSEQPVVFRDESRTTHQCTCGQTVCCGKHKGCCHKKKENKIRFIKERTL